ncbi:MAG: glycosyltransferase [Bacteroidetes bacterium]|nr:MAG: glycosyltransferase [Bacteroidota bacterium]
MKRLDISVVVPLYNEEESLPRLLEWIDEVLCTTALVYEVVLVDDGSSDGSWLVIGDLLEKYAFVRAVRFQRNYGKAAALNEGFRVSSGEVVITMDADLQDSPEEIPDLYRMVMEEGYDLVSGWKKQRLDSFRKRFPSKFYNGITRAVSGIKLHDFNCGLKAYRRQVVHSIEIYGEMHRYIPLIAKQAGFKRIGEKVVRHRKREFGTPKYERFSRGIKGVLDLISLTFMHRFGSRPMHVFGFGGSLLFMAGFLIFLWLAVAKFFLHQYGMTGRPLFYVGLLCMILGTQLFIAGFLGEMIARTNVERNNYLILAKRGWDEA